MSAEKSRAFKVASVVFAALVSSVATAQDVMDVAAQQGVVDQQGYVDQGVQPQAVEQVVQQPQLQALPVAQAYAAAPLQYDPITDGQPVTRVFKLAHANADEVAERFNAIWSGEFGTTWRIFRIATSFPEANAVMVTAPTRILDMCEEVIAEIDQEARQVYIEARFVELGNTASHKLGIDWSMLDGMSGSATLGGGFQNTSIGSAVTSYQKTTVSNTRTESYSLSSPTTSIIGYGGSSGTTPITSVTGGKDGDISFFNGTLNFSEMYLTLRALESTEDARIFSNPKIIVSSGKKATVDMTTKYPNVLVSAKRTLNGNAESLDLAMQMLAIPGEDKFMFAREAFFSWGISLDVVPRIGTNGLINVTIVPTISDLDTSYGTDGFVTAGEGQAEVSSYASKYPIIKVQRLITEFNMASGTTAVIGGLSRTVEAQKDSGIPWLRNIPWIGPKLFGSKVRVKEQREIIVFVTVGLVDPKRMSRDAGLPKNAVLGRQYVNEQKLEPGDRPEKNMEGIESLDMRPLEEQAKDPLKKAEKHGSGFMNIKNYLPFKKDSDSSSSSEESAPAPHSAAEEEQTDPSSQDASATETL